jgi:hypothetical protein
VNIFLKEKDIESTLDYRPTEELVQDMLHIYLSLFTVARDNHELHGCSIELFQNEAVISK